MQKIRLQAMLDPKTMEILKKIAEKEQRSVSWTAGRILEEVIGRKAVGKW